MSKNFELLTQLGEKSDVLRSSTPPEPGTTERAMETAPIAAPTPLEQVVMPPSAMISPEAVASPEEAKLVQRLFILPGQDAPRSVVFCGIDEEDQSSLTCTRVAELLAARPGSRVCLVDANWHAPSLHKRFNPERQFGISDLSAGASDSLAYQVPGRNLWLLDLVHAEQNAATVDSFSTIIPGLAQQFSTVLIAAGAINLCPEAITLGQLVDGVILVIRANSTRRIAAMKAKELLEGSQVRMLGAVLTERTYPIPESLYRIL